MTSLLVGTDDGLHRPDGEPELQGRQIDHVAPIPGSCWAVADGSVIFGVPDDAEPEAIAALDAGTAHVVLPDGSRVWVGGSNASLYRLLRGQLDRVASFDQAPGRGDWYTPWGGPPDVRSMTRDAAGTVYVNVHVGGILRSDDGEAWIPTIDVDADVHQVLADPDQPGRVYAATARGLAVTDDGGDTWTFTAEGLAAPYCRAVARSEQWVFVSASRGPRGEQAAVYRRPVSGGPLQRCTNGLPEWFSTNVDTHCLAASGEMVAAADPEGTVYVSTDEGDRWEVAATGLSPIRCLAIG